MSNNDRERKLIQAQGSATIRALHLRGLAEAGSARVAALEESDRQLDRIARLLHDAIEGGVSISEISRVTGVSRQTLYELRARHGDTRDLRLAVLQGLLMPDATLDWLAERLKRPESEIDPIIAEFVEKGLASEWPEPHIGMTYGMTAAGLKALQEWAGADDPTATPLWEES